jgi:hypothetical protein
VLCFDEESKVKTSAPEELFLLSAVGAEMEEFLESAKSCLPPRLVLGRSNSSFSSLTVFFAVEVIGLPLPWATGSSPLPRVVGVVGVGVGVEEAEASGFDFVDVSWIFGFSLFLGAGSSSSVSERKSRRSSKSSKIEKKFQIPRLMLSSHQQHI